MMTKRNLPKGWRWEKLIDVTEIIMGQSPPSNTYRKEPEGLPFFQGKADFGDKHPVARNWCVEPSRIAKAGDILLSVRAPVGPTNIADVDCCIGRGLAAIRPTEKTDRDFILFALKFYENDLVKKGSGSTFDAIKKEDLHNLEIPLPPLEEQKRIATRLDEQMRHIEQARLAAEESLSAAWELLSAYLREVFEGKEAQNWDTVKLGDISTQIQNGIYKSADFYGHGHPFLRMYNLSNQSWNLVLDKMAQVEINEQEYSKFKLNKGDLLISRVNSFELVGKCSLVDEKAEITFLRIC